MNKEEIICYLGPEWVRVKEVMRETLRSDVSLLSSLNESVMSNSGKMLRPMISLLVSHALGTPGEDSLRFAVAAELLHNATLMHDDVADESAERRGKPTLYSLLGPTAAVLVGDFWLSRTVELVYKCECRSEAVQLFTRTMSDLSEGEMLQMQKAGTADTGEDDYFRIIYGKTASLFVAAAVSAAYSVDAPDNLRAAVGKYARCLGIAFQIKDDILDYSGTPELGKPVGIDILEQKITLPLLGALKDSPREAEIRAMVREIGNHPENVTAVRQFVIDEGGIGYAEARLEEYVEDAVRALDPVPDSFAKEALKDLARYNSARNV